ncbi:uncharacterized protein LOC34619905 [Cyclospora cayetanensis]|uniref:Uncharacterized protein LOC34619905 n=1 Tax=Cyclospora cayetanensis TaxID=88456 RepID=A0A6P6RS26_9EIME|nr:uncharacterized protein LOC34619905 [Cyclospora cayetanensis]
METENDVERPPAAPLYPAANCCTTPLALHVAEGDTEEPLAFSTAPCSSDEDKSEDGSSEYLPVLQLSNGQCSHQSAAIDDCSSNSTNSHVATNSAAPTAQREACTVSLAIGPQAPPSLTSMSSTLEEPIPHDCASGLSSSEGCPSGPYNSGSETPVFLVTDPAAETSEADGDDEETSQDTSSQATEEGPPNSEASGPSKGPFRMPSFSDNAFDVLDCSSEGHLPHVGSACPLDTSSSVVSHDLPETYREEGIQETPPVRLDEVLGAFPAEGEETLVYPSWGSLVRETVSPARPEYRGPPTSSLEAHRFFLRIQQERRRKDLGIAEETPQSLRINKERIREPVARRELPRPEGAFKRPPRGGPLLDRPEPVGRLSFSSTHQPQGLRYGEAAFVNTCAQQKQPEFPRGPPDVPAVSPRTPRDTEPCETFLPLPQPSRHTGGHAGSPGEASDRSSFVGSQNVPPQDIQGGTKHAPAGLRSDLLWPKVEACNADAVESPLEACTEGLVGKSPRETPMGASLEREQEAHCCLAAVYEEEGQEITPNGGDDAPLLSFTPRTPGRHDNQALLRRAPIPQDPMRRPRQSPLLLDIGGPLNRDSFSRPYTRGEPPCQQPFSWQLPEKEMFDHDGGHTHPGTPHLPGKQKGGGWAPLEGDAYGDSRRAASQGNLEETPDEVEVVTMDTKEEAASDSPCEKSRGSPEAADEAGEYFPVPGASEALNEYAMEKEDTGVSENQNAFEKIPETKKELLQKPSHPQEAPKALTVAPLEAPQTAPLQTPLPHFPLRVAKQKRPTMTPDLEASASFSSPDTLPPSGKNACQLQEHEQRQLERQSAQLAGHASAVPCYDMRVDGSQAMPKGVPGGLHSAAPTGTNYMAAIPGSERPAISLVGKHNQTTSREMMAQESFTGTEDPENVLTATDTSLSYSLGYPFSHMAATGAGETLQEENRATWTPAKNEGSLFQRQKLEALSSSEANNCGSPERLTLQMVRPESPFRAAAMFPPGGAGAPHSNSSHMQLPQSPSMTVSADSPSSVSTQFDVPVGDNQQTSRATEPLVILKNHAAECMYTQCNTAPTLAKARTSYGNLVPSSLTGTLPLTESLQTFREYPAPTRHQQRELRIHSEEQLGISGAMQMPVVPQQMTAEALRSPIAPLQRSVYRREAREEASVRRRSVEAWVAAPVTASGFGRPLGSRMLRSTSVQQLHEVVPVGPFLCCGDSEGPFKKNTKKSRLVSKTATTANQSPAQPQVGALQYGNQGSCKKKLFLGGASRIFGGKKRQGGLLSNEVSPLTPRPHVAASQAQPVAVSPTAVRLQIPQKPLLIRALKGYLTDPTADMCLPVPSPPRGPVGEALLLTGKALRVAGARLASGLGTLIKEVGAAVAEETIGILRNSIEVMQQPDAGHQISHQWSHRGPSTWRPIEPLHFGHEEPLPHRDAVLTKKDLDRSAIGNHCELQFEKALSAGGNRLGLSRDNTGTEGGAPIPMTDGSPHTDVVLMHSQGEDMDLLMGHVDPKDEIVESHYAAVPGLNHPEEPPAADITSPQHIASPQVPQDNQPKRQDMTEEVDHSEHEQPLQEDADDYQSSPKVQRAVLVKPFPPLPHMPTECPLEGLPEDVRKDPEVSEAKREAGERLASRWRSPHRLSYTGGGSRGTLLPRTPYEDLHF